MLLGGQLEQNCIHDPGETAYTHNGTTIGKGRQVIVPSLNFSCFGKIHHIVSILTNVSQNDSDLPLLQIWRPSLDTPDVYHRITEIQLPVGNLIENTTFYISFAILVHQITVQPGDVIGYYQPTNPHQLLWSIKEDKYVSYSINANATTDTINTRNMIQKHTDNKMRPFVRIFVGKYDFYSEE